MDKFKATIEIIGVNPYVSVPNKILKQIFKTAGVDKGPIAICGHINKKIYSQTLVKYNGAWRLYVNHEMLQNSPKRIGETIEITVAFDPRDRTIEAHPKLMKALSENVEAEMVFNSLSPSRKKEIIRYISKLKQEESRDKNIIRAIRFLLGKQSFVGRDKP